MSRINLGKVGFTDGGEYSATTTYRRFDFVQTVDSTYVSLQDNNIGHVLTDKTWWKPLALGKQATEAAKKANDAAALANEKAGAADNAAGRVNEVITSANNATGNAQAAAQNAQNATTTVNDKVTEINAAIARLKELEETITAQARQQPTTMSLKYPKQITEGVSVPHKIEVVLAPAGTGSNVIFLCDPSGTVIVSPNGYLQVNRAGKSVIHVIPTENTSIYKTIEIEVVARSLRFVKSNSLRLTANGALRFK